MAIKIKKSNTGETPEERLHIYLRARSYSKKMQTPQHLSSAHTDRVEQAGSAVEGIVGAYGHYINCRKFGTSIKYMVPFTHRIGMAKKLDAATQHLGRIDIVETNAGMIINVKF